MFIRDVDFHSGCTSILLLGMYIITYNNNDNTIINKDTRKQSIQNTNIGPLG